MAKDLKSLVSTGSARELQHKLESWQKEFEMNTAGENMSRCCEILELNTAIQKQLYSILSDTSQEDTIFEGTIKSCVPCTPCPSICCASSENITQNSNGGDLQLRDLDSNCRLQELEDKLSEARAQLCQMEQDMKASCVEDCKTLKRLQQLNDCEQQIQLLQDEIALLDGQKCVLQSRLSRTCPPPCCKPCKPCKPCCKPCKPCCKPCKPCKPCCKPCKPCCLPVKSCTESCTPAPPKPGCTTRRAFLIARFNFIYAKERLDAESVLRPCVCDMETVQRIIYAAVVESFRTAKMAFWKIKIGVKETLALDHCGGAASLECAALDYIACHKDLYDVCCSVQEVICCLSKNPKLPCPGNIDFTCIEPLIRELCCLAFQMQTVMPPLEISFGVDGECFNKTMYYRSCDSDFSAPFVAYHIWPALMEGGCVVVKGEVVTKKMVMVTRSRSLSTVRSKASKC